MPRIPHLRRTLPKRTVLDADRIGDDMHPAAHALHAPPGFEQRVRDSFARQAAMTTLGARLGAIEAGRVEDDESVTYQEPAGNTLIVSTFR